MTEAKGLDEIRSRLPAPVRRGLARLHANNRSLWDLEDQVRGTQAAPRIAALKRAIDRANLARHAAVKDIDAAVLRQFPCGLRSHQRGAVIDSSSVGQLLDRLSILVLKRARVSGAPARALATAHWDHVLACLDRALTALAAGRWVHTPLGEVKQYGAAKPDSQDTIRART